MWTRAITLMTTGFIQGPTATASGIDVSASNFLPTREGRLGWALPLTACSRGLTCFAVKIHF